MNKTSKAAISALLVFAVAVILIARQRSRPAPPAAPPAPAPVAALPRLVDLGSTTCIPCQMQAPVLEELAKETAGRLIVDVIDVQKDPTASAKYAIMLIPTQIFYDASGKELYRHEGFMAREDIVARWKEFGVDLSSSSSTLTGS